MYLCRDDGYIVKNNIMYIPFFSRPVNWRSDNRSSSSSILYHGIIFIVLQVHIIFVQGKGQVTYLPPPPQWAPIIFTY